jgi:transcriptional regulator with XRE-family HTH domain
MRNLRLKELRKEKGLTQKEVANALTLSQSMVSKYERGIMILDIKTAANFADFYGVSLDYIYGDDQYRFNDISEQDIISLSDAEKNELILNILRFIRSKK